MCFAEQNIFYSKGFFLILSKKICLLLIIVIKLTCTDMYERLKNFNIGDVYHGKNDGCAG